jgi:hypothetical protein
MLYNSCHSAFHGHLTITDAEESSPTVEVPEQSFIDNLTGNSIIMISLE